jgi:hypothetical protein
MVSNLQSLYPIPEMRLQLLVTSNADTSRWDETDRHTSSAVIMDLGFHTHAVSFDSKYIGLVSVYDPATGQLSVTGRKWLLGPSLQSHRLIFLQHRIHTNILLVPGGC